MPSPRRARTLRGRPPLETAPSVSKREGNHQRHQRVSPMTALKVSDRRHSACRRYASPLPRPRRAHLARPPLETAPSVSNHKGNHRRSHQRALPTTALERRRGRASRSQSWIAVRARPRFLVGWEGGERSRHGRRMRTCGHATLERGTSPGGPPTTESVKRAP